MGRSKHPLELKLHILQMFEEGNYSINELCERFSLDHQTFRRWKMKYEADGRKDYKKPLHVNSIQKS